MPEESTALATAGDQLFPLLRAHGIEPFEYRGAPAFLPRQVAAALGYATPQRMLSWLAGRPETAKGSHRVILEKGELSQAKDLLGDKIAGGKRTWRETILLLPGLVFILDETRVGSGSPLRLAYRSWREMFFAAAFAKANEPVATTRQEPPKHLAGPVEMMKAAVQADPHILAKSCDAAWLREQATLATEREKADRARAKEKRKREAAEDRKVLREQRAQAQARRQRKPPRSTLW